MKRLLLIAAIFTMLGTVAFAKTIKVGVIGPFSGLFAVQGNNLEAGMDA